VDRKSEYNAAPFWLLIILLEQLLFFPSKKIEELKDSSLHPEICRRARLFSSGQVRQLYQESRAVISQSRFDFEKEPPEIQKSAQSAADNNNFKSAIAILIKT